MGGFEKSLGANTLTVEKYGAESFDKNTPKKRKGGLDTSKILKA